MIRRPRCPICRIEVSKENKFLPFCSERCRLLDLGHWLEGDYRVAGEQAENADKSGSENQDRDGEPD